MTEQANMKRLAKQMRRFRWGRGLCVVTRDPLNRNRLNVLGFNTPERAQDFARRAVNAGIKVLGVA